MDLLRNYLGTTQTTPSAQTHERLVTKMYDLLGNQALNVIPYLEYILAIGRTETEVSNRLMHLDAAQLRQQIFLAVKELILAEANRQPVVLILEDLHWADEASLDLFEYLVERIQNAPILFVAISRTIQEDKLMGIVANSKERLGDRFTLIELQNLSIQDCEQLFSELVSVPELPPHLHSQILHKSAGIPFFLEELIRMLIDDQVIRRENAGWRYTFEQRYYEVGVPENINALILARFDRLTEEQRRVLRCASVVGKEFNLPTIAEAINIRDEAALRKTIDRMVQKGFLIKKPGGSDTDFLFRHVLTCDAVYDTLLRRDKQDLHLRVGEAIEKLNGDQLGAQVELLAGHFIRSDRLDKALHYLTLAGQKAAHDYANQQASANYAEALKLLATVPHNIGQALQVWIGMGDVLLFTGEYARARHFFELAIHAIHGTEASIFEKEYFAVKRKIGITYERQGDYQLALDHLSQALVELESTSHPDPVEKAQIINDVGWIHFLKGNFEEAQEHLQLALSDVESTKKYDVIASIYNRLGAIAYQERAYDRADGFVRKSLGLREVIGDRAGVARLYNNLGLLGLIRGNLRDAEINFTKSIDLLERIGDAEGIALAYINLGLVKFDRGNFEEAAYYLEKGYQAAEQIGHRFYLGLALMYIGRLQIAQHKVGEAENNLFRSLGIFEELGVQDHQIDAQFYMIESYLEAGDIVLAEKGIQHAEALLAKIPEGANTGSVADGRLKKLKGMLARLTGNVEIAEKLLLESADIFVASEEKLESAHTLYYLSSLELTIGKRYEAYHHMREARSIYDQSGADLHKRRAQEALSEIGQVNLRVNLAG
jgi:predicted ATPase